MLVITLIGGKFARWGPIWPKGRQNLPIIVGLFDFLIEKLKLKNIILVGLSIGGLYASLALEKGVKSKGLVLINTLRKNNSRLKWINETMVNVARYGGTSLLMDMNMPGIFNF